MEIAYELGKIAGNLTFAIIGIALAHKTIKTIKEAIWKTKKNNQRSE